MKKDLKGNFRRFIEYIKWLIEKPSVFKFSIEIIKNFLKRKKSIYHALGTHIISGYMGSGKTLLMNCIINSVDKNKYFFISNIKEFNQENVYNFDLEELFSETKQICSIPTTDKYGRKLYALILDEINLKFNRRLNKTKEYNNQFVGLVEFLVSSRHQDVPRVYFIGQKLELQDSQLQSLFYYWHDCLKCKKIPSINIFKDTEKIVYRPYKIIIRNYKKIQTEGLETYVPLIYKSFLFGLIKIKRFKYKVSYYDTQTYNTTALATQYKELPEIIFK